MPAQQLNLLPKVPTRHLWSSAFPECQCILVRCWHCPSYLVYVLGNLALYGIRASHWISSNDVITLYLLRRIFKSFNFTLRLIRFFPTNCTLQSTWLIVTIRFNFHQTRTLIRFIIIFKVLPDFADARIIATCSSLLDKFSNLIHYIHYMDLYSNLALIDDTNSLC